MTLTLRVRLAAISAILFGVLLVVLSVASYQVLARSLGVDVTQRLLEITDGLHGYLRFDSGKASVAFDPNDGDQAAFVTEATRYYQVYDTGTGRPLVESNGFTPFGLQLTPGEVQAYVADPQPFDLETDFGRLRIANSVRKTADGRTYLLQVGVSLSAMDGALGRYRELLSLGLPLALVIAGVGSWWLSGFALRPLVRTAAAIRPIDLKTLDRRLPVRGAGDELDHVAVAFNETLARLELAVSEMRQFSAALAHELRTPLSALRGEIDLALGAPGASPAQRQSFASQLEEIDRLTRLIDHVLTLARAESGQIRLTSSPVNLGDLTRSIVEQLEPVAEARFIDLHCERSDAIVVNGDAGWLERLLLNLLDNALKFTPERGRVLVRVFRDGQTARMDVQDTGVGLSPQDAHRVFERFFRADWARSSEGAGLGLSLVQWIAAQHHGTVTVESRLGEGSTFTVRLPIRPRD